MPFDFDSRIHAEIVPDRDAYLPGDYVMLHVRLTAQQAVPVRAGRVDLVARRRYSFDVSEWDQTDNSRETRTRTESDEWSLTDSILGAETLPAGEPVERWVRFVVPRDAAPSGNGAIVGVAWSARVAVDVPRRRDAAAEVPLRVNVPREIHADRAETPPYHEAAAARLTLLPASRHVAAGSSLTGELVVEAQEDFAVRAVWIELLRREDVFRELGQSARTTVVAQQIAGETEFRGDRRYVFPFTLAVPDDVLPCCETELWSVGWFLCAVLDRARRADDRVAVELNLFNAASA